VKRCEIEIIESRLIENSSCYNNNNNNNNNNIMNTIMDGFAQYPRVNHAASERRKTLSRSIGSFSIIEDNIVAPTPRKVIACSPKPRREKRKGTEESLFGEAGFEIQNILLQPRDVSLIASESSDDIDSLRQTSKLPIAQVLNLNEEEVIVHPTVVGLSLRSSNPITLNTPFHLEERSNGPTHLHHVQQPTTTRVYQASGRLRNHFQQPQSCAAQSRKELHRSRSASWPSAPKSKKAEKSS
jgi:hypothetical protein